MKKIIILFGIILFGFQTKINEKFEMKECKINSIGIYQMDKYSLIKKFGKPQKTEKETNEFTGEIFYLYKYNGLEFEVNKNKVTLSEIISNSLKVTYKGSNISIGQNAKILKTLFSNYLKNNNSKNYQIDIPIRKSNASYFQFLIENEKIMAISISENY